MLPPISPAKISSWMVVGPHGKKEMSMNIGAVIQARVGSIRLPNKVLLSLPCGSEMTVLGQIIQRAKKINAVNNVIVATTDNSDDKVIESISDSFNVFCFKGDTNNVLSRYFCSAEQNRLDVIVRLTGDNPCIDPAIIDSALDIHIRENSDFTFTNKYPLGMNVEIISFKALKKAFLNASSDDEFEHVTPFFYANTDSFKTTVIEAPDRYKAPDIRLTLDMEADYSLLCAVYEYLYDQMNLFTIEDVIRLFNQKPWLGLINKKIVQKKIFNTLEEELSEAVILLDQQDLKRARDYLRTLLSQRA